MTWAICPGGSCRITSMGGRKETEEGGGTNGIKTAEEVRESDESAEGPELAEREETDDSGCGEKDERENTEETEDGSERGEREGTEEEEKGTEEVKGTEDIANDERKECETEDGREESDGAKLAADEFAGALLSTPLSSHPSSPPPPELPGHSPSLSASDPPELALLPVSPTEDAGK